MNSIVEIKNLSKSYGQLKALDNVSLDITPGKIVGLIGSNGSGKSTMLRALTGLIEYDGFISILGNEPKKTRSNLMKDVGVIHDIPVIPPWMKVKQAMEFQSNMHPQFDLEKFKKQLSKTNIELNQKVNTLSKGMKTQLHLAMVLSTESKFLVLDEPTHGLDILFRKQFYNSILEDYFNEERSVFISTHQVEEIKHILSDVVFIRKGKIILSDSIENLHKKYLSIVINEELENKIRKFNPIFEQKVLGRINFILKNVDKSEIEKYGEINTPSISDIFVAIMGDGA